MGTPWILNARAPGKKPPWGRDRAKPKGGRSWGNFGFRAGYWPAPRGDFSPLEGGRPVVSAPPGGARIPVCGGPSPPHFWGLWRARHQVGWCSASLGIFPRGGPTRRSRGKTPLRGGLFIPPVGIIVFYPPWGFPVPLSGGDHPPFPGWSPRGFWKKTPGPLNTCGLCDP